MDTRKLKRVSFVLSPYIVAILLWVPIGWIIYRLVSKDITAVVK